MPSELFRLSRQARVDLEEIADYLGKRSATAAARVLDELLTTFEVLARNPLIGELRDDLHPKLRMFVPNSPADSFVIFYYPLPNGIEISDVIHTSRDWVGMFARGER